MSAPNSPDPGSSGQQTSAEENSALFASLVMQQVNMAAMLLGQGHQPDPAKPIRDLEAARLFIDHLEMLEAKTKGNLTPDEDHLLKQSLTNLRMAYVYAVEEGQQQPAQQEPAKPADQPTQEPSVQASGATESEESRKKFSKKY